jgi:hypothetical protein
MAANARRWSSPVSGSRSFVRMLWTCFSTVPSVTHRRRAMPAFERPSAMSASTRRHPDVDEDEIGLVLAHKGEELLRVPSLAHDVELGAFEQACDPLTQEDIVLGNDDACLGHQPPVEICSRLSASLTLITNRPDA